MSNKTIASLTLGCKVNMYDTEAIMQTFHDNDYTKVKFDEFADVYLINTCTVTNLGDKKSRQMIRKAKKINPNCILVACGCYAQVSPEEIEKIEGINIIAGTKDRLKIFELVNNYNIENGIINNVTDISKEFVFEPLNVEQLDSHTRAYLKIQEGCDKYCTYCIIPYARGPVRSRKKEEIIKEVNILAKNGYKEIVLAGIHVASYGKDFVKSGVKVNLLDVIKEVAKVEGIERIRFSSVEPNIVTEEFMEEISKIKKVCHHFHLSLQSGCDKTLKEMNRSYNCLEYFEAVNTIKKYFTDCAITTDIIVGFPNETDSDFEDSLDFARKIGFSKIHVFPYSAKKGTKAFSFDNQINPEIKAKRSKKMIEISDEMEMEFLNSYLGKTEKVLFENIDKNGYYEGHTSNYIKVLLLDNGVDVRNNIVNVKLLEVKNGEFIGILV